MATKDTVGAVPRRHEVEELATTAATGRRRGATELRHEREELALRLSARRGAAQHEVATK